MAEPLGVKLLPAARDALQGYLDGLLQEAAWAPSPAPPRVGPETSGAGAAAPAAAPDHASGGPPEWARGGFQALLFKVGPLRLAVPLVRLHGVLPWPETIAAVPGQPAWSMGLMRHRERNVRVVDTASLVGVPGGAGQRPPPANVLIVGDGGWGLAADAIGDVLRLEAEEVKWRSPQGRRPWLAGTLLERLCALLDTDAFAGMLAVGPAAERVPLREGHG